MVSHSLSPVKESTNNISVVTTTSASAPSASAESMKTFSINLNPVEHHDNGKNATVMPGRRITRLQSKAIDSGKSSNEQSGNANGNGMSKNGGAVAKSRKKPCNQPPISDNDTESETYVAGKRNRRLISTPFQDRMEKSANTSTSGTANKGTVSPAKRTNRSVSCAGESSAYVPAKRTKKSDGKHGPSNDVDLNNDSISRLIAVNCKLTKELLDSKKVLSEKNNSLLKIQENLFQKELELVNTKNLLSAADRQVEMIRKELDQLKAERHCEDLIQFDHVQTDATNPSQGINDEATNGATTSQADLLSFDLLHSMTGEASDDIGPTSQQPDAIENRTEDDGNDFQWTPTE